jgi:hypothetical protein
MYTVPYARSLDSIFKSLASDIIHSLFILGGGGEGSCLSKLFIDLYADEKQKLPGPETREYNLKLDLDL